MKNQEIEGVETNIEEFNYESPTVNPNRKNIYENSQQEVEYKQSGRYKHIQPDLNFMHDFRRQLDDNDNESQEKDFISPLSNEKMDFSNDHDSSPNEIGGLIEPHQKIQVSNKKNGKCVFQIRLERLQLSSASSSNKKRNDDDEMLMKQYKSPSSAFNKQMSQNWYSSTPAKLNNISSIQSNNMKAHAKTVQSKNIASDITKPTALNVSDFKQGCNAHASYSKRLFQENSDDESVKNTNSDKSNQQTNYAKQDNKDVFKAILRQNNKLYPLEQKEEEEKQLIESVKDRVFGSPFSNSKFTKSSQLKKNQLFTKSSLYSQEEEDDIDDKLSCYQIKNQIASHHENTAPKKSFQMHKDDISTVKKVLFDGVVSNLNVFTSKLGTDLSPFNSDVFCQEKKPKQDQKIKRNELNLPEESELSFSAEQDYLVNEEDPNTKFNRKNNLKCCSPFKESPVLSLMLYLLIQLIQLQK